MKYLKPGPFSGATSNGRMTDRQYEIAVGALVLCTECGGYVKYDHVCPALDPGPEPYEDMCDCDGCR